MLKGFFLIVENWGKILTFIYNIELIYIAYLTEISESYQITQ